MSLTITANQISDGTNTVDFTASTFLRIDSSGFTASTGSVLLTNPNDLTLQSGGINSASNVQMFPPSGINGLTVSGDVSGYVPPAVFSALSIDASFSDVGGSYFETAGWNGTNSWPHYNYGWQYDMLNQYYLSENRTFTATVQMDNPASSDTQIIVSLSVNTNDFPDSVSPDPYTIVTINGATNNGDGTYTVTIPSGQSSATFDIVIGAGGFTSRLMALFSQDYSGATTGTWYPWKLTAVNGDITKEILLMILPDSFTVTGGWVQGVRASAVPISAIDFTWLRNDKYIWDSVAISNMGGSFVMLGWARGQNFGLGTSQIYLEHPATTTNVRFVALDIDPIFAGLNQVFNTTPFNLRGPEDQVYTGVTSTRASGSYSTLGPDYSYYGTSNSTTVYWFGSQYA